MSVLSFYGIMWLVLFAGWAGTTAWSNVVCIRALSLTQPPARRMEPQNVWLTFVPLFNLYWQFVVTYAVADSLGDEMRRRNYIPRQARPGLSQGMTACIFLCFAVVPAMGLLIANISNIVRIIHLQTVSRFSDELEELIRVQNAYAPAVPQEMILQQQVNPEEAEKKEKENPERFMPPPTPEDEWKRWGRKD
ncbi:MAG TPA: hypothetical protein VFU15_02525 [Bacteroidia bacterium]|nr:hypothetical protein [Bacteroidia bacterium]